MWVLASERTIYVIVYKVCVCSVLTELHVVVCQKRGRRETEDFLGRVVVHLSCSVVFLKSSAKQQKKKLPKAKIISKLLFHVEKIVISKNTSTRVGLLKQNTPKKKFVHGKQLLPRKIAI